MGNFVESKFEIDFFKKVQMPITVFRSCVGGIAIEDASGHNLDFHHSREKPIIANIIACVLNRALQDKTLLKKVSKDLSKRYCRDCGEVPPCDLGNCTYDKLCVDKILRALDKMIEDLPLKKIKSYDDRIDFLVPHSSVKEAKAEVAKVKKDMKRRSNV